MIQTLCLNLTGKKKKVSNLGKQVVQLRSGNDSVRVFTCVLLYICFSQWLPHLRNRTESISQLIHGKWREEWTRTWFNKISAALCRDTFYHPSFFIHTRQHGNQKNTYITPLNHYVVISKHIFIILRAEHIWNIQHLSHHNGPEKIFCLFCLLCDTHTLQGLETQAAAPFLSV